MKIASPRPLFVSASLDVRVSNRGRGVEPGRSFAEHLKKDGFERGPRQVLADIDRRISQGAKDGSLTPGEAAQLQRKADALHDALKDGVSPHERQQLAGLSREVHHQRHDAQRRPGLEARPPDAPSGASPPKLPSLAERKAHFAERISAGLADGSLTAREARHLAERLEALGPNPDSKQVDRLSRDIFTQRHDLQVAFSR